MVRFGVAIATLACMAMPALAQESTEQLKKELQELRAEVEGLKAVNETKEIPASGKVDKDAMAADESPVMTLFKQTKLSGFVDAGYQFSFNHLNVAGSATNASGNPTRIFDTRANSFYLNEAHIQLERLASKDMIVGYHIELVAGHDPLIYDGQNIDLQEGWVQIMAPVGDGLDIKLGKMASLAGYEVLENVNNMNYTRGVLWGLVDPKTSTGVRVSYGMGGANHDMFTGTVGFNNGFNQSDRFSDGDHGKMVELNATVKPIKDFSISGTVLIGNEHTAGVTPVAESTSTNDKTCLIDLVAAYTMDKLTMALEYDYWGSQGRATAAPGTHAKLTGFAVYGKYQFTDVLAEALRFEYFSDVNGLTGLGFGPVTASDTGTGSRAFELTLTTEVKVANQLILRFELRSDNSNNHNMSRDGKAARGDNTLGVEAIMPF